MSEVPAPSGSHTTNPHCLLCDSSKHVLQVDMPEHRYIHLYRCLACGQYWTTTLRGDRILTGLDDDSMLFL